MKQVLVMAALKALVVAALPGVEVRGFGEDTTTPETIGAGGTVIGYPGDPGEPEVDLSPPAYNYDHDFGLEIAAPEGEGGDPLVAMVTAIGAAIRADRYLGGLCQWLEASAVQFRDRTTDGATPNWADVLVTASYIADDPLG